MKVKKVGFWPFVSIYCFDNMTSTEDEMIIVKIKTILKGQLKIV